MSSFQNGALSATVYSAIVIANNMPVGENKDKVLIIKNIFVGMTLKTPGCDYQKSRIDFSRTIKMIDPVPQAPDALEGKFCSRDQKRSGLNISCRSKNTCLFDFFLLENPPTFSSKVISILPLDRKGGRHDLHETIARIDEPPSGRLTFHPTVRPGRAPLYIKTAGKFAF